MNRKRLSAWLLMVHLFLPFWSQAQEDLPSARKDREHPQGCLAGGFSVGMTTTGPDFKATVASRGKPMPNVSIILEPGESPTGRSPKTIVKKTNLQGIVRFSGVRHGVYTLGVSELVPPMFWEVVVKGSSRHDSDPSFEWPKIAYSVRAPRGVVMNGDGSRPMHGVVVELLDLRTSEILSSGRSDENGAYALNIAREGVYVLRFRYLGELVDYHDVAIEIIKNAEFSEMPLLRLGGCDLHPVELRPSADSPKRVRIAGSLAEQMTHRTVQPREIGVKGDAVLSVLVDEDGKVQSIRSVSGDKRLVEAAIPAVSKWEFSPYFLNGTAIQFETRLTIHFKGTKATK